MSPRWTDVRLAGAAAFAADSRTGAAAGDFAGVPDGPPAGSTVSTSGARPGR